MHPKGTLAHPGHEDEMVDWLPTGMARCWIVDKLRAAICRCLFCGNVFVSVLLSFVMGSKYEPVNWVECMQNGDCRPYRPYHSQIGQRWRRVCSS